MKIVFFTNKCKHGASLLIHMKEKNIYPEAIFIEHYHATAMKYCKILRKCLRQDGFIETTKLIFKKLTDFFPPITKQLCFNDSFYTSFTNKLYIVDDFNGQLCEQLLTEIRPDVIVLGGARIIRKNILRIPKWGTLNAHPGLLPKYRGVDVIPWAIYNGDTPGVTVHFVDEGVDTGGIIMQETIPIERNDTIASLKHKAEIIAGKLISQVLSEIEEMQKQPETRFQAREEGKQYYKMPKNLLHETELRLKAKIDG